MVSGQPAQTEQYWTENVAAPHISAVRWLQMILCQAALLDLTSSEEISLLHDTEELLLIDLAISFVNHLLKLFISHSFSELLGHALQVFERDLPSLVIIEQPEGLENLILWVAIQDFMGHHLQKFFVLDSAAAIIVDVRDHLLNLFLLGLETKSAHGNLQLFGIDGTGAICIKQIKCLLDFLLLLLSELFLLLATGVETTKSHVVS